jgi:hypothetical protein
MFYKRDYGRLRKKSIFNVNGILYYFENYFCNVTVGMAYNHIGVLYINNDNKIQVFTVYATSCI